MKSCMIRWKVEVVLSIRFKMARKRRLLTSTLFAWKRFVHGVQREIECREIVQTRFRQQLLTNSFGHWKATCLLVLDVMVDPQEWHAANVDRKSVVTGKSVIVRGDLGGRRPIK